MKAQKMTQTAMPSPFDWCTGQWAAAILGVSERTVRRYAAAEPPILRGYAPRSLGTETPQQMFLVADVEQLHAARQRVAGNAAA